MSVEFNQQSFAWGRLAAHDLASIEQTLNAQSPAQVIAFKRKQSLDELISHRTEFLTQYQNVGYAQRYRSFVERVRADERRVVGETESLQLTEAVARYLFKLMAYKDEYEVARLHSDPAFKARIASMFEGDYQIKYHLAPPLLSKRDEKGHLIKQPFGSWVGKVFPILAKLRFLRGSLLDPFGHTEERKTERALIEQYCATITSLSASLDAKTLPLVVEIARIPEEIRGYGHVKERHLRNAKDKEARLLEQLHAVLEQPDRRAA